VRNVVQFVFASPYVVLAPELEAFARESFPPGRPLLAAALDLMQAAPDQDADLSSLVRLEDRLDRDPLADLGRPSVSP
jgi:hypothetical protein